MGKRNKQKDEGDPILQKKRKVNQEVENLQKQNEKKQKQEVIVEEDEQDDESEDIDSEELDKLIEEEENQQNQDQQSELNKNPFLKFAKTFNIKGLLQEDQQTPNALRDQINSIPCITFTNSPVSLSPFDHHFNQDYQQALKGLIDEVQKDQTNLQSQSQNQIIKQKMQEIFRIKPTKDDDQVNKIQQIDPVKEKLSNKIKIKDFNMKKEFKTRTLYSIEKQFQVYLDTNAQKIINENQNKLNITSQGVINNNIDFILQDELVNPLQQSTQSKNNNNQQQSINLLQIVKSMIYSTIKDYHDLIYIDNEEQNVLNFRQIVVMHVLNHLMTSNFRNAGKPKDQINNKGNQTDKINSITQNIETIQANDNIASTTNNNDISLSNQMQQQQQEEKMDNQQNNDDNKNAKPALRKLKSFDDEVQDQQKTIITTNKGYTRCKVLIITPFKGDATSIIKEIIQQCTKSNSDLKKTSNKQKFQEQFEDPDKFMEDDFRIGISILQDKHVRLFAPFNNCDIIVSSPLGMRLLIGAEGEVDREFSFLSSIEILLIDRAQAILMQNWTHLEQILQCMNKIPKHQSVTSDLAEIRPYFFENLSKFFRQTLIYSEYQFTELNSLRMRFMHNYQGCIQNKLFYNPQFKPEDVEFSQEFIKIEISDFKQELEERFDFFKSRIWDNWRKEDKALVFCNSYFEYLKLKIYFQKLNMSLLGICEYTSKKQVQSRLSMFKKGQLQFILFSERAFYFDVCQIKNMKALFFYSLPKNQFIYKQLIESLEGKLDQNTKIVSLFTKYDALILERIVGSENAKEFLADYNKSTTFIL